MVYPDPSHRTDFNPGKISASQTRDYNTPVPIFDPWCLPFGGGFSAELCDLHDRVRNEISDEIFVIDDNFFLWIFIDCKSCHSSVKSGTIQCLREI